MRFEENKLIYEEKGEAMNTVLRIKILFAVLLLMTPAILWAADTITLQSRVEMEVIQTNEQGEKVTVMVPAERVLPGETVVYTNTYHNSGDKPAGDLVINNPVPENTEYIAGSAFGTAEVVYSADNGASFAAEGKVTVIDESGKSRPASPREYTNLRWIIQNELQPGESGEVGFRVRLQ